MTLLNKLFIESFTYFDKKEISIPTALKLTDILLLRLPVNESKVEEYNSYLDNLIELNKLLQNYFTTDIKEELDLFDNSKYEYCKTLAKVEDRKTVLDKIKSRRLALYQKYESKLFDLLDTELKVA